MIKLKKLSETNWIVNYDNFTYKINSLTELFSILMTFEVKFKEIEYAILELEKMNHNFCEFGIWKRFVYSENQSKVEVYN